MDNLEAGLRAVYASTAKFVDGTAVTHRAYWDHIADRLIEQDIIQHGYSHPDRTDAERDIANTTGKGIRVKLGLEKVHGLEHEWYSQGGNVIEGEMKQDREQMVQAEVGIGAYIEEHVGSRIVTSGELHGHIKDYLGANFSRLGDVRSSQIANRLYDAVSGFVDVQDPSPQEDPTLLTLKEIGRVIAGFE